MAELDNLDRIDRFFPDYFKRFKMPEGAHEESITVYRACRSGKCDEDSFLPSFEESGFELNPLLDEDDPSQYSLSVYEKPKDVKRFVSMLSDYSKPYKIAVGETTPSLGLVQRTRERTGQKNSHVDWWLYIGAKPHTSFKLIDDFDKFFEEYKKSKIV